MVKNAIFLTLASLLISGLNPALAFAGRLAKPASFVLSDSSDRDTHGNPSVMHARIVGVEARDSETLVLTYESADFANPGMPSKVVLSLSDKYETAALNDLLHKGEIGCIPAKIWVLNYHRIGMDGAEIARSPDPKCSESRASAQIEARALALRHRDEAQGKYAGDLRGWDDWSKKKLSSLISDLNFFNHPDRGESPNCQAGERLETHAKGHVGVGAPLIHPRSEKMSDDEIKKLSSLACGPQQSADQESEKLHNIEKDLPPIRDQGNTNLCYAYSTADLIDFYVHTQNGTAYGASGIQVIPGNLEHANFNGVEEDENGDQLMALFTAQTKEKKLNLPPFTANAFHSDQRDVFFSKMRALLDQRTPFGIGLCANDIDPSSADPGDNCGPHAVTIVGAGWSGGECKIRLRNSWGSAWGSDTPRTGYADLTISELSRAMDDMDPQNLALTWITPSKTNLDRTERSGSYIEEGTFGFDKYGFLELYDGTFTPLHGGAPVIYHQGKPVRQ